MSSPAAAQPLRRSRAQTTRNRPFRWRPDQQWEGYLFLLPSFLGFLFFVALPVIFVEWNLLTQPQWIGLANYRELLQRDPVFFKVAANTAYFMVTIVPLQLALGLALAVALNQPIRGRLVYRVIYFMPVVTTIVAGAIVFRMLLNRDFGLLSSVIWRFAEITGLGIQPPDFLNSSTWAKPGVVLLTLWKNVGFTMVIYLAALQGVPQELYDAAEVDGANSWNRFWNVTLPLISPTTFFLFIIQTIGAFQLFTEPFVMSPGSCHAHGRLVHLSQCLRLWTHGQSLGSRLVPVPLYFRVHLAPDTFAAEMGPL
jgi:multiple sugar transport system permease protein